MEITIHDKPCLLLETAELLYGWVNHIPAKELAGQGPFCIPVSDVEHILRTVCQDVDPDDKELQFYFGGVRLETCRDRLSCVAITILSGAMPISGYEVRESRQAMADSPRITDNPVVIRGINGYTFGTYIADSYTNLSEEIGKLNIPIPYKYKLIEAYSDYWRHVDRMCELIEPLAERLKPLLEPWVRNAAPVLKQWSNLLEQKDGYLKLMKHCSLAPAQIERIVITLRYFSPQRGPAMLYENPAELWAHAGIGIAFDEKNRVNQVIFDVNDYAALRLLANPDRITMLGAMLHEPMSGPDLMEKYGFHSGSVFRDLNSMYNAGLLSLSVQDGKNTYRTNFSVIQKLTKRMLQAIDPDFEA